MTRLGLGPVFALECKLTARRWQVYAARSGFVLVLLLGLWGIFAEWSARGGGLTTRQQAAIGQSFFFVTSIIQLGLVGLAAPAAAAGAICQEKARGNLVLMLATDLSSAEIVLGKLVARLMPVLGLIACTFPVTAMTTLMGGVDPVHVNGAFAVLLSIGVFGCSLALTLSVWGRKIHEVLLATYAFGLAWLVLPVVLMILPNLLPALAPLRLARPAPMLLLANPVYLVMASVEGGPGGAFPSVTLGRQLGFLAIGLAVSTLLLLIAAWRIRRVAVREPRPGKTSANLGALGRLARSIPLLRGPSLDANPVLWREMQRTRPGLWARLIWGAFAVASVGITLPTIAGVWAGNRAAAEWATVWIGLQVAVGLLLLSIPAATSLAEERQRGSLDVLMTTPLTTSSIVRAKWIGIFRRVPVMALMPTLLAATLAIRQDRPLVNVLLLPGLMLAYGAVLASLGLAMATWQRRPDRAIGLTTGIYVAVTIASIPLAYFLIRNDEDLARGMATASPLFGPLILAEHLESGNGGPQYGFSLPLLQQSLWCCFWILAYSGVALVLYCATLATFNRCLGRMEERGDSGPRQEGMVRRSKKKTASLTLQASK